MLQGLRRPKVRCRNSNRDKCFITVLIFRTRTLLVLTPPHFSSICASSSYRRCLRRQLHTEGNEGLEDEPLEDRSRARVEDEFQKNLPFSSRKTKSLFSSRKTNLSNRKTNHQDKGSWSPPSRPYQHRLLASFHGRPDLPGFRPSQVRMSIIRMARPPPTPKLPRQRLLSGATSSAPFIRRHIQRRMLTMRSAISCNPV